MNYKDIFMPGGLLNRSMEQYEFRSSQLEMAELVDEAFTEEKNLIVEAGTGTGKTLAYLLPAIQLGERVVISTGTKNLQEQLYYKDIPFLKEKLGLKFKSILVKGRNNYICRKRFEEFRLAGEFKNKDDIELFRKIEEWQRITKTGDIAEAKGLPEDITFWKEINARGEVCIGKKCQRFDDCFITNLRRKAMVSDIILVNHHLLFADHNVKLSNYGEVLPEYRFVILDEAHQVESVATNFFGFRVSDYQIRDLLGDCIRALRTSKVKNVLLEKSVTNVEFNNTAFFSHFSHFDERSRIDRMKGNEKLREQYELLNSSLVDLSIAVKSLVKEDDNFDPLYRRTVEIIENLKQIIEVDAPDFVYWCENTMRTTAVSASPLFVNDILRDSFFSAMSSVVLTSATLSVAGNFDFIKYRVGLDAETCKSLPSEFDYESRAVFYAPPDLPLPSEPDFYSRLAERASEILKITDGSAFMLFTNYRGMEECYDIMTESTDYNIFLQGELGKSELIAKFKESKRAVLMATMSFWQGVDVPGEDLKCVIIDKLPFAVPSDPMISGMIEYLDSKGRSAFNEYQLPSAVMLLKQGLGRLIRHKQDYGIAAVMDKRLITKGYRKFFIQSLPPYRRTKSLEELEDYYRAIT
ncbi:MAG: DEAD/DEAH box helicase [Acidobacteria bacterium]|nr:DEAD/DEAH box helicase [Acidobacteriota bacterium]